MIKALLPLSALALLSACGSTGVFDRDRPDEFAVTRTAPLAVPTDFSLPAPQQGTSAAQNGDTKQAVLDAMFDTAAPRQ